MSRPTIVIVDNGLANVFSVATAMEKVGASVSISNTPASLRTADKIVLPGVGAFSEAMKFLKTTEIAYEIALAAKNGKPILGICLGFQLLFSNSHENGIHEGLNLISGSVKGLKDHVEQTSSLKVPQIGWNEIEKPNAELNWDNVGLRGIPNKTLMYFLHSYFAEPTDPKNVIAKTQYGSLTFCSMLKKDNILGCQFHPEKSGKYGHLLLKNFVEV